MTILAHGKGQTFLNTSSNLLGRKRIQLLPIWLLIYDAVPSAFLCCDTGPRSRRAHNAEQPFQLISKLRRERPKLFSPNPRSLPRAVEKCVIMFYFTFYHRAARVCSFGVAVFCASSTAVAKKRSPLFDKNFIQPASHTENWLSLIYQKLKGYRKRRVRNWVWDDSCIKIQISKDVN